jgi:DNA gyrase subunit A
VEGLLVALGRVDQVIEIVRKAPDQSQARVELQQDLGTSEVQTDAILRLQLGQLTRLNNGKLTEEKSDLEQSRARVRCEHGNSCIFEVTA